MATLENRGNGSWMITVSGGYDENGKQIRVRRMFHAEKTSTEKAQRKQAEKFAAELETDFARQQITSAKKVTVSELYPQYLADVVKRRGLTECTRDTYSRLFEQKLIPAFGKMAVRDIKAADLNKFFQKLQDQNLSGTYQLKYYQQLHELFVYAQRTGIITINPCNLIYPPKKDTKEAEFYDTTEVAAIMAAIAAEPDPKWRAYFLLSVYMGSRPGELIGLNWGDYDKDKKTIFIQAGSYQGKSRKCVRTEKPKTRKSIRKISLPPDAVTALNTWKAAQAEYRLKFGECWPEPDAIFTSEEGYRMSNERPSKHWRIICNRAGIRYLPPYSLRHTNCSLLISSGELSVEEVAARMGHQQTSTTLNIYSHVFSDADERATNALMNAIQRAKGG